MVLRNGAALHVNFTTERGGYPSSLMGTIAHIRQSFIDAELLRGAAGPVREEPGRAEEAGVRPAARSARALRPRPQAGRLPVQQRRGHQAGPEDRRRSSSSTPSSPGPTRPGAPPTSSRRTPVPLLVASISGRRPTSMYATQGEELRKKAEAEIYPANAAALAKDGHRLRPRLGDERRRAPRPQGRARRDQGRPARRTPRCRP